MSKLKLTDENGDDLDVPMTYEVCPTCSGHGSHSRGVERDGGGFTSSEWAEEDQDFREDYLSGVYDRTCEECDGQRVVLVPDWSKMDAEEAAGVESAMSAEASFRAEIAAERRAGCR